MSQVMKFYSGMFLLLFLTISSLGILSAFLEIADMQQLEDTVILELENSHMSPEVLEECRAACEARGYELLVTSYPADSSQGVAMAEVELKGWLDLPVWSIHKERHLFGYVR